MTLGTADGTETTMQICYESETLASAVDVNEVLLCAATTDEATSEKGEATASTISEGESIDGGDGEVGQLSDVDALSTDGTKGSSSASTRSTAAIGIAALYIAIQAGI